MNWLDEYNTLTLPPLAFGAHDTPESGLCAMEMVAFLERLPHSDKPPCTCDVLGAYVRGLNDAMDERQRNELLLPLLPSLIGTTSERHVRQRAAFIVTATTQRILPLRLSISDKGDCAELCRNAVLAYSELDWEISAIESGKAAEVASIGNAGALPIAVQILKEAIALGPNGGPDVSDERVAELAELAL